MMKKLLILFSLMVLIIASALYLKPKPEVQDPAKDHTGNNKFTTLRQQVEETAKLIEVFLKQNPEMNREDIQITFSDDGTPHIAVKINK